MAAHRGGPPGSWWAAFPAPRCVATYDLLGLAAVVVFLLWLGNFLSYRLIKDRVLGERTAA